jgi:hypothetical protein
MISIALPTLFLYADQHGWDVVISTETDLSEGRAVSWARVPLIKSLMRDYELVWWMDADALIVDLSTDIRSVLQPDRDLYLVEHYLPLPTGFTPSCGVMLWRSSEWSLSLLDEMWDSGRFIDEYPWENGALIEALGYLVQPFFVHLHPTDKMKKVSFLPSEWNTVWSDPPNSTPRVHHHGSMSLAERRQMMLHDFERWRTCSPPKMTRPSHAPVSQRSGFLGSGCPASRMTRDDLPLLLNERKLVGRGLEVGVYAGDFSAKILCQWQGQELISVDPWLFDEDYLDISNVGPDEFELLWLTTCRRLERFGDRSSIWRMAGDDAALRVDDGTLDFIYIDARHDEASVRKDLDTWFRKVRPGGILAGHDYLDGDIPNGLFGVKSAVDDFVATLGVKLHVTGEDSFQSWIIEVPQSGWPEPANLIGSAD